MSADLLNLGSNEGEVDEAAQANTPIIYSDVLQTSGDSSRASISTSDADEDDSEFDGPTLKKVVEQGCKEYDVGTAVMPKLLLHPDVDELTAAEDEVGETMDGYRLAPQAPQQSRYARTVEQEFTAVVIEHHLKWAPLCTAEPGPLPDGSPVTDRLGRYDFGPVDAIVDWALERKMKVKGHVLVWVSDALVVSIFVKVT